MNKEQEFHGPLSAWRQDWVCAWFHEWSFFTKLNQRLTCFLENGQGASINQSIMKNKLWIQSSIHYLLFSDQSKSKSKKPQISCEKTKVWKVMSNFGLKANRVKNNIEPYQFDTSYMNAAIYVFHFWQTTFSTKDATNCEHISSHITKENPNC